MAKTHKIIALHAPVTITAGEGDGDKKGPPRFDVVAYTGGPMSIEGYDAPVVVDLAGLQFGNSLVANLDHDRTKRVGHVTNKDKSDGQLKLGGLASAATPAKAEVVESAADGFVWQASIEAQPTKLIELDAGKTATVNGQEISGPAYIARKSVLKGFAFVSHGADDNTSVTIAASAASNKEKTMKAEVATWIKAVLPSVNVDDLSAEEITNLEADYEGREGKRAKTLKAAANPFAEQKAEAKRRADIRAIANGYIAKREDDADYIDAMEKMYEHAIKEKMSVESFRCEMAEQSFPEAHAPVVTRGGRYDPKAEERILQAAICAAGRLSTLEKVFTDQELQAAHDRYPDGISLNEFIIAGAKANGYRGRDVSRVTLDIQRAAFPQRDHREIRAQGWSTIDVSSIVSNTANKFIREGWMAVDQTPFQIAAIRSVRNFQEITTISLTGGLVFEKLGADGEIKHGTLGETTYGNKADTYARMLAITRQDIINDDLGALTTVPRRLGRGGMLLLAHIFWTEFLNPTTANFFHSNNANVNTGVADMTIGGLAATEAIFDAQTDPDGLPLSVRPAMIIVPPALKPAALTLMNSERLIDGTGTTIQGDANIWRGRFKVVSSPYMANSAYTGYSAVAWYMVADPNDIPLIEIVALNGKVEPTVDTADTDFNTLGVQMRGYSDVGVRVQEPRAGVRADGGSS